MNLPRSQNLPADQKETLLSIYWGCDMILHFVFNTAVELNLLEIIWRASSISGAEFISAAEITSHLPAKNEKAAEVIDRILHFLASHSIVKCTVVVDGDDDDEKNKGGKATRLYGLTPLSYCFIPDEEGFSRVPRRSAPFDDKAFFLPWKFMKEAILEGGTPFEKANNGMNLYQYLGQNSRLSMAFDEAMQSMATAFMRDILQSYNGFEDLKELVDVGGGIGVTLNMIISKYPLIKGINFDLPQVIQNAPVCPGVEHVAGDMFESLPKAEAILLKRVLHNWSDEKCTVVLKNCWAALPVDSGKVIIIEMILPDEPSELADISSRVTFASDFTMFALTQGGRERSLREFEALANVAGFKASKLACRTPELCVLEFYKNKIV